MILSPSPNFEERIGCAKPSLVILHYTGMKDGASAIARLCDATSKVSAHYVVEEDGRVFALVDEKYRAWHAGKSYWRGITDINSHSIGIEIVNPGHEHGYRAFPDVQMQAVLTLCLDIKARHGFGADAFIGHSDIAPARKEDPGELFDWPLLAQNGVGVQIPMSSWKPPLFSLGGYPGTHLLLKENEIPAQGRDDIGFLNKQSEIKAFLSRIGYNTSDEDLVPVIRAFQRHFVPHNLSGVVDDETAAIIRAVAAQVA
jgi:N-acetylmuramoyl-L-alanine amidase